MRLWQTFRALRLNPGRDPSAGVLGEQPADFRSVAELQRPLDDGGCSCLRIKVFQLVLLEKWREGLRDGTGLHDLILHQPDNCRKS